MANPTTWKNISGPNYADVNYLDNVATRLKAGVLPGIGQEMIDASARKQAATELQRTNDIRDQSDLLYRQLMPNLDGINGQDAANPPTERAMQSMARQIGGAQQMYPEAMNNFDQALSSRFQPTGLEAADAAMAKEEREAVRAETLQRLKNQGKGNSGSGGGRYSSNGGLDNQFYRWGNEGGEAADKFYQRLLDYGLSKTQAKKEMNNFMDPNYFKDGYTFMQSRADNWYNKLNKKGSLPASGTNVPNFYGK